MFGFLRQRTQERRELSEAHQLGVDAAGEMADEVEGYLSSRLPNITVSYLEVFKERLQDLPEHPELSVEQVAEIEFEIFLEQIEGLSTKMAEEVSTALADWYAFATEMGVRQALDELVQQRVDEALILLRAGGKTLLRQRIGSAATQ